MTGGEAEAALRDREHLAIVAHELRSPVAALTALAAAFPEVPASERPRGWSSRSRPSETSSGSSPTPSTSRCDASRSTSARWQSRLRAETVAVSVAGRTWVEGDPTRLRQVLSNLVANGLRHGSRVAIDVGEGDGQVVDRRGRRRAGSRPDRRRVRARRERSRLVRDRSLARACDRRGARRLARARPRLGPRRVLQAVSAVRFRRGLRPSSDWSACARAATARRMDVGSSTAVSPRSASTSERSHSSVLNVTSEIADLSVSDRAPRSSFQRAMGGACQRSATAGSAR